MSHPARKALTLDQLDNLGFAIIQLAKELWVVKDRQMVAEALLGEKGLIADLDAYQPDAALAQRLAAERERYLGDLTSALFGPNANDSEPGR